MLPLGPARAQGSARFHHSIRRPFPRQHGRFENAGERGRHRFVEINIGGTGIRERREPKFCE
jgi:hypothetical protein